jgi:glycosyltransferase involved in cell wall biosynthesis
MVVKLPYYICTSRQVNWKRLDLAVKACAKSKRRLLVVGEGPEHKELVRMADGSELIEFLPLQRKEELARLLAGAKGYIFPSMEPFGIAPVEALAAGCPVIAFGKGGALDYVKDGKNGVLFEKQSVKSLSEALDKFERKKFNRTEVSKSVDEFAAERFDREIRRLVDEKSKNH